MIEKCFQKNKSGHILLMMIITRLFAIVTGGSCVYYVCLSLTLTKQAQIHFAWTTVFVVAFAATFTVMMALWETRGLRKVLKRLERGKSVRSDVAELATRKAVEFPRRHALREMAIDLFITATPICVVLYLLDGIRSSVILQIHIAGFLGISSIVLATFFISERWLRPVIRYLQDQGANIPFPEIKQGKLQTRLNVGFGLMILITVIMIGSLANQRAHEIQNDPAHSAETVSSLVFHSVMISIAALIVGIWFSRILARSVTVRVDDLIAGMQQVQQGNLSIRLQPTGTDEIDRLALRFNEMIGQLDQQNGTIRDLNVNLERKVEQRTEELSQSQHELEGSLEKLREHDKMKTEFFSNVSHELRTPLTTILTPLDRILTNQAESLGEEIQYQLTIARANGNRLLRQINQLLDFSKLEAGQVELRLSAFNPNDLIEELMMVNSPLAEDRQVELRVQLGDNIPEFAADEEKIDTILSNLISNALKFTPEAGSITVTTSCDANMATISVQDTGIGIAEANYAKVFERFGQIDGSMSRQYSGTGLGMALTKELVELHGGTIQIESEIGHGTKFWFTLPLRSLSEIDSTIDTSEASQKRKRASVHFADLTESKVDLVKLAKQREQLPPETPRVLIVDDTADMRGLLVNILVDEFRLEIAEDGLEGLRKAQEFDPHLIISDVMMPHMNGYEFCHAAKSIPELRQTPFILLTAKAEMSMKIEGLETGADDYLTKPFNSNELMARTRSLIKVNQLRREIDARNVELEETLEALEATRGQLVHSEKMASLGQLAAGIAHELNNSINPVYNGIKPLRMKMDQLSVKLTSQMEANEDQKQSKELQRSFGKLSALAGIIEEGATRTARIVSDLKTFSHPGQGGEGHEPFDLHECVEMCLNLLENKFKSGVSVEKEFLASPQIVGPAGQINQTFMNILSNAHQAMEEGGTIFIQTWNDEDCVKISFRDTGCGIPEEHLSRIFDPFFTTKPVGVGTGLGLSISYSILTKIGGNLECSSEAGAGTTFVITLPLSPTTGDSPELIESREPALTT